MNPVALSIHQKAIEICKSLRKTEAELMSILGEVENHGVYQALGYTSLFLYCRKELGLSESQSYQYISVTRKSREVPELQSAIIEGKVHISNARRIVPLLNNENKDTWLGKAATLTQRELEREIVKEKPAEKVKERIKPVSGKRLELRTGISEELEGKLKRERGHGERGNRISVVSYHVGG